MRPRWRTAILFPLFLLPGVLPRCAAQSDQHKIYDKTYALVIGITDYKYPDIWPKNPNASNDAKDVADFLQKSGFQVTALYNEEATKTAIEEAFPAIAKKVGENDAVVVYFAGHGHTEKFGHDRGYIIPWDGTKAISSYIMMEELKDYSSYMEKAKHQLFILDSCYGGILGRGQSYESTRGMKRDDENEMNSAELKDLQEISKPTAREVLTAGDEGEKVLDGGGVYPGHSLFTGVLLAGLKGSAGSGNGYITFTQLVKYVKNNINVNNQHPHWDVLEGHNIQRDFVFVLPNSVRRRVAIAPVFEPEDASAKAQNLMVQRGWPTLLLQGMKRLQETEHIRNVEFALGSTNQVLETRGGPQSESATARSQQQSDYTLKITYLQLDSTRIRARVRFQKNTQNLPDIPDRQVELSSLDLKPLAREILRQFAPDPDIHLHLEMTPCANCSAELPDAMESWASQLNLPRIKYVKDKDDNSAADIGVLAVMGVSTERGSDVFEAVIAVSHGEAEARSFSARGEAKTWRSVLKHALNEVEAYLAELTKQ